MTSQLPFCTRCKQGPETHRTIDRGHVLCDDGMPSDSPIPHMIDGDDSDSDDQETLDR